MPDTLSELVLQESPIERAVPERRSWTWLPKLVALLLVFFWLANLGISLLITHTRLQRRITGKLQSVFGREVEVGSYDFSLWGGPTLEAQAVTFAEDPRFGHEYFLRTESLTVRLRWRSLLRGHMDLGKVSLARPSLNLVRNAEGDWNLAEWLPKPATSAAAASAPSANPSRSQQTNPPAAQSNVRFTRLEVESGRINFKLGDEKIPFAFTTVNGYVEPDGAGRWRVNLEASPTRAAVVLQSPGTLYLSGSLGGTSSRLRPASLDLAWGDASISDVLRLFRGDDFGVRGNGAVIVHAETQADVWNLQARVQLRELHRWDLPMRPDNPGVDVNARLILNPLTSALDVGEATIEGPASFARGSAHFDWSATESKPSSVPNPNRIEVVQSQISLKDALAWIRGFHPDVASDLSVSGTAVVSTDFVNWPPRLVTASAAINSADLSSPRLREPAHLTQFHLHYDHGSLSLPPASIVFGTPEETNGSFRLDSSTNSASKDLPGFHLIGSLPQVRDLVATASALGWNISRGWDLAGPVRCDLRWPGNSLPWKSQPVGMIEWGTEAGNASLLTPFLNHPVEQIRARADLKPDSRHIAVTAADAFGGRWTGAFDHRDDGEGWRFAASTDHLSVADLDRWLNPRWRQSFIYRVLPFLNPNSPSNSVPEGFRAFGRLSIDEFTLAELVFKHLHGDMTVGGRHLEVSNARAQLHGGTVDGSLDAELLAIPTYRVAAEYSRVDLAALTSASPSLEGMFAGSASGDIALNFTGATQSAMASSLQCSGTAQMSDPEIRALNLQETVRDAALRPGSSVFREASASFTCAAEKINLQDVSLFGASPTIQASGIVNFNRTLNVQVHPMAAPVLDRAAKPGEKLTREGIEITGSLARPSVRRVETKAPKP